jgi:hypothetical protein
MKTKTLLAAALVGALATITATSMAQSQSHYDDLANLPFVAGYIAKGNAPTLLAELFFRARGADLPLGDAGAQHVWHEGRLGEGLRQLATTSCLSSSSGSTPRR